MEDPSPTPRNEGDPVPSAPPTVTRALRNIGALTGAQLAARGMNFVLLAAVARSLGSDGAGGYSTAVSLSLVVLLLSDLGLSPRLIREASVRPDQGQSLFREAMAWKRLLAPLVAILIVGGSVWLPYPADVRTLFLLVGASALLLSFAQTNEALLRARERMQWEAVGSVTMSVLTTLLSVIFLVSGQPLPFVGAARIAGAAGNLVVSRAGLRASEPSRVRAERHAGTVWAALPYATTASMNLAYGQVDILVLSIIAPQSQVGEYALISRIVLVAGTFASTGAAALLPVLARTFASASRNRFWRTALATCGAAMGAGVIGALVLHRLGSFLMGLAYGDEFSHLVPLFLTATSYVALRFAAASMGMVLTAMGRQSLRAACILAGLVATLVFIMAWAPTRGVAGAVDALVASECVLVLGLVAAVIASGTGLIKPPAQPG